MQPSKLLVHGVFCILLGCGRDEAKDHPPELTGLTPPPELNTEFDPSCDGGCTCEGECCPKASECYLANGVGDECMAQRDNSKGAVDRLQFRLTWSRSEEPKGNAIQDIYKVLKQSSELRWDSCYPGTTDVAGGFIQLLDIDLSKNTSRVGYAAFVGREDVDEVRREGMCMLKDEYTSDYALSPDQMILSDNWPPYLLPPPMPQPWKVRPVLAKRVTRDFDVSDPDQRASILEDLAGDPEHQGIFYLEDETGYSHGYSPLAWVDLYTTEAMHVSIPIREAQTFYQVNDARERSCIGALRGDALDPQSNCVSDDMSNPPWGCVDDTCPGKAPGKVEGYFLITEIEQVFTALGATLCITYPTKEAAVDDGFPGTACRESPKWERGELPTGDWCARTNGPMTESCHDAFHTIVYQTYQAFPIRDGTCRFDGTPNP